MNDFKLQKVIATTCLGLNHVIFTKRTFDFCVIDEACQVSTAQSWRGFGNDYFVQEIWYLDIKDGYFYGLQRSSYNVPMCSTHKKTVIFKIYS